MSTTSGHKAMPEVSIPTLSEIFVGKVGNWCRKMRTWRKHGLLKKAHQVKRRRQAARLEMLEPRLLLSADLIHNAELAVALDASLRVADIDGVSTLQLVDNSTNSVLGEEVLDEDINVTINGSGLNDRLVIDFGSSALPHQVNVAFDGGAGDDTLRGPAGNNIWSISGTDTGSVGGISFGAVENLEGAADNEDTFVFDAAGSISGLIEGGAGGFDSLVLADGTFAMVTFTITGAESGTIARDSDLITYSGLEPTTDNTSGDKTFDGTAAADTITIRDDSTASDNVFIVDIGVGEDVTFTNAGVTSLTVNGLGGADTIVIEALDALFDGNITINAGDQNDTITINAKTGPGTYTINGDDGTGDSINVTRDANFTLTNSSLTVGAESYTLTGLEVAALTGGASANTFTVSGWTGTGTLNGDTGIDTVAAINDVNFTLTNASLVRTGGGHGTLTLTSINEANLSGGSGGNSIDASGFTAGAVTLTGAAGDDTLTGGSGSDSLVGGDNDDSLAGGGGADTLLGGAGNDTLTGGGGGDSLEGGANDDTYVFGNAFGADTLVESVSSDTDTLDFTAHTGTLTVSADKTSITSSDGSSLTQIGGEVAEEIDVTLLSGAKTALTDGLQDIVDFIDRLQTDADAIAQLVNQLPLIDRAAGGSLAEILALTESFDDLKDDLNAAIALIVDATPTLSDVVAALDAVAFAAPFTSFDFSTDYRGTGTAASTPAASGTLEALIDLDYAASMNKSFDLDFGAAAEILGIGIEATIDIALNLTGSLTVGLTTTGTPTFFLVPTAAGEDFLNLSVSASASLTSEPLNLGFLDVTIGSATFSFTGSVTVDLTDPNTDGRVVVSELTGSTVAALTDVTAVTSTFDADATVSIAAGVQVPDPTDLTDGLTALASATFELTLPGSLFGDGTGPADLEVSLETTIGGDLVDLLNFSNTTPSEMMGFLSQIGDVFFLIAQNKLLESAVPFTDKTVGELLDFPLTFKAEVLDPLFVSGNALRPDDDGDGSPDFNFSGIQDLIDEFASNLGISELVSTYDPVTNELSFTIDFSRALGFGEAAVKTLQQGSGSANEKQTVTINAVASDLDDTFLLAFPDADGLLEFTAPIAYNAPATGTDSVEEELEALEGIDNVTVTKSGNVYTIEFIGTQANTNVVDLVSDASELAGAFPVDFGASLGDFASITTTGSFSIAATLDAGFTFTIDLSPSQTLEISPPVFTPDNIAGVTVELPDGAATNTIQVVTVENATSGSFKLLFGADVTSDIAFNASAATVETQIETLTDITGVTVTGGSLVGNDRTYTVTFVTPVNPATLLVADTTNLRGPSLNGLLSANGTLTKLTLLNEAVTDADPGTGTLALSATTIADFSSISISSTGNTTFTQLVQDLQAAVNQEFVDEDKTLGFLSTDKQTLSTGALTESASAVTASGDALTSIPNDISFTLKLVRNLAGGVVQNDQVSARLRAVDLLDADDSGVIEADELSGSVTTSALAAALETAINNALTTAGFGGASGFVVDVGVSGVRLTFDVTNTPNGTTDTLEFVERAPVTAAGGGGRIALSAAPVMFSANELEPGIEIGRQLQLTLEYNDTAYQEMGLLSSPTEFNGTTDADAPIAFTLVVNGTEVDVFLPTSDTSGNTSIDDLVDDLQAAVDTGLNAAGFADGDVEVVRVDSEGNRIALRGKDGVVETLALNVPADGDPATGGIQTNGAVTELGFLEGDGETRRAKAAEFYLENVFLDGSISLATPSDITVNANVGFLGVTATGSGTLGSDKFIDLDLEVDLKNPVDGSDNLTIALLTDALSQGKFIFDAADVGDLDPDADVVEPGTGVISGELSGGVGFSLEIEPAGVLSGLSALNAQLVVDATSPNWFIAPPLLSDPWGFGEEVGEFFVFPTDGTLTLAQPAPGNGQIAQDMAFVITDDDGSHSAVGRLRADDTIGFATQTELEDALQDEIDDAIARLVAAGGATGTIAVDIDGSSNINLTGTDGLQIRASVVDIDFTGPDVSAILDQFKDLSFDDIIVALQLLVDLLQGLNESDAAGGVLDEPLPLIDRSAADLIDLGDMLLEQIDALINNPAGSIQALDEALKNVLGDSVTLAYDPEYGDDGEKVITLDFIFERGVNLSRPFNLDLADAFAGAGLSPDIAAALSSLVGLSASGNLAVSADATFTLQMGLDIDGANKGFFIVTGDDGTGFEAGVSASGANLDFDAQIGPFGLFVIDGEASLDGTFAVKLLDSGGDGDGRLMLAGYGDNGVTSELGDLDEFVGSGSITVTGTGSADLPLYIGTEDNPIPIGTSNNVLAADIDIVELLDGDSDNGIDFTLPEIDFFKNLQLPNIFALLSDPALVIDGLDRLLVTLQDMLNGEIFGLELPLVGDLLADNPAANIIEDFRLDFLQPLAQTIRENNLNIDGLADLIKDVIYDVFSNEAGGLDLLRDSDDLSLDANSVEDVLFRYLKGDGSEDESDTHDETEAIQFDFDIGKIFEFALDPIDIDLGIPALGIAARLTPRVTINFNLHVGFGLDINKGFYFVSDWDDPTEGANDEFDLPEPEMFAAVTIHFTPDQAIGDTGRGIADSSERAEVEGRLTVLALEILDGLDLDDSGTFEFNYGTLGALDTEEMTKLYLQATIDIVDADDDGKLTIPELISGRPLDTFQMDLTGGAMLRAEAEVNFGSLDPSLANVLPKITFDALADFSISASPGEGVVIGSPEVALLDVTLDLGSFISDFAGPTLIQIAEFLDPFEFLIGPDGFLNMRIPLLSDLMGRTITGKDMIVIYDPVNGPKVVAFLDFVETLIFLTNLVQDAAAEAEGGNLGLNFGDLVLFDDPDGGIDYSEGAGLVDEPIEVDLGSTTDLRKAKNLKNATLPSLPPTPPPAGGSKTSTFTSGVTEPGGITFPILQASEVFKLILGQPATLFQVELPELGFSFFYRQTIPIWGPLVGFFGGGVSGGIDMGFGYDTLGLQRFMASDNPITLLDGFFLSDLDPATGADRAEGFLSAQITVGAGISAGLVTAGVEGGIDMSIDFNLADLDGDGKVRMNELVGNVVANDYNPLAIFDVHGLIEFFLRAFVEIDLILTEITFEYEFVRLKLFEFDIPFERPAILANQTGDELVLNIGDNSAGRLNGNLDDIGETIHVKSFGGGIVVWSDDFNVSELVADLFPFYGVSSIVFDGGAGDDNIDLFGVNNSSVTIEGHGGDGNDTIMGGGGADLLFGDGGDDTIEGGGGADEIYGGLGADTLKGNDEDDVLYGEEGNDTLDGGGGNDTYFGGAGGDTYTRSAGLDLYDLGDFGSVDIIDGNPGTAVLDLSDAPANLTIFMRQVASTIQIQVGYDLISGEDGQQIGDFNSQLIVNDATGVNTIIGSSGADTFHIYETTAGQILLDGGKGSDRYFFYADTGSGNQINAKVEDFGEGLGRNTLEVVGSSGADTIHLTSTDIDLNPTNQTVVYTAPDDLETEDSLQIKIKGNDGDDTINVESTAATVPVRVEGGEDDDIIIVGGSAVVDGIAQTFLPGLNTPFGLGPLVLVGGLGHDVVTIDDSGDTSHDFGNLTAFLEKREGISGLVEVGVVSGLGMTMYQAGTPIDGRVEFEGFEAVEVLLGGGNDAFTVGGGFDLDRDDSTGGQWDADTLVNPEIPKGRLSSTPGDGTSLGIQFIKHTIAGLVVVDAGGGTDTINVINTQDLSLATDLSLFGATTIVVEGSETGNDDEVQTVHVDSDAHGVGYFTLSYRYNETLPIAFGATASDVDAALQDLFLIGLGINKDNVSVVLELDADDSTPDGFDEYTITFQGDLGMQNIPDTVTPHVAPLVLQGGAGVDHLNLQAINETTFVLGGAGGDFIDLNVNVSTATLLEPTPDPLEALTVNGVNAEVTLDGQDGGDDYDVHLIGGDTDSLIHVFDTGASGADSLTVFGIDSDVEADWDLFLLRAATSDSGLAFIAHLNKDSDSDPINDPYERVDYDNRLEAIVIEGLDGNDSFYSDSTRAAITINAGEGNDFAQIGQLYKTRRTPELAGVLPEDVFATIETTRGWLSEGISDPMTINFGAGNDTAIVFHNLAVLTLNGGADDDTFIVQAFALAGSQEDKRAQTDLSGDAGADTIQYAVNAPVNINGGDGLDTVIVIGTEFGDDFVVTRDGVFGAGLNVNFINVEFVEVDSAEGDDRFFILSTGESFVTRIVGNLGTDFFFVEGPTPRNGVISNDLLGHSGIISHDVTGGSGYEGIKTIGVSSNVADNDEPMIRILETHGSTRVIEDAAMTELAGGYDSYRVVLTRPVRSGELKISMEPPNGLVFLNSITNALILDGEGKPDGIQLTFTAGNWYIPQEVRFAVDPDATGVERLVDIQHKIDAPDAFAGQADASTNGTDVGTLTDNDVTFPTGTGLATDAFPEGLRGLYVKITDSASNPEAAGQVRMILSNTADTLTVNSPWTVLPPSDALYEILYFSDVKVPNVRVEVFNADMKAIVVDQLDGLAGLQTGGSTQVAEGAGDAGTDILNVRLSSAPGDTVKVDLASTLYGSADVGTDGQLRFFDAGGGEITSLTFTTDSWNAFQRVSVQAYDDGIVEGFHKSDLRLTASGGGYDTARTIVTDIGDDDHPGVRIIESDGSTDLIEFTGNHFGEGVVAGFPNSDRYQVVLTQAPAEGETVTVHLVSEPTRTSRLEIRSFIEQVLVSTDGGLTWDLTGTLTFDADDWNVPQTVYVRALDDARVDGSDAQVFAQTLDQVNAIQGPLFIVGGVGENRTGLLERDPIMLPYERNARPDALGAVIAAEEGGLGNVGPVANVTIDLGELSDIDVVNFLNLVDVLRDETDDDTVTSLTHLTADDFVNLTIEITEGAAKNKVRIVKDASAVNLADGIWNLEIDQRWFSPFTGNAETPNTGDDFTLYATNPNLLVNETEQADRLIISDADNVNSYDDPALDTLVGSDVDNLFAVGRLFFDETPFGSGPLPLNQFRLTGLGMGGDRTIGGTQQPGGITIGGIEQIQITLGAGNNKFTVEDTPAGTHLTLNTGAGDDIVNVESISGHTFVNLGAGNDTINIANDDQELSDLLGLLTMSGDVPRALVETLANGSPAGDGEPIAPVNEIQRLTIDATSGTFALSLGSSITGSLAYDISAENLETALGGLASVGDIANVDVTKAGSIYRITFVGGKAGIAIDPIVVHDLGLTNGRGALDVLNIDDSGFDAPTVGVLTSSSLTGLSTQQVNEIQSIVVDATQGTFTLTFGEDETGALAYDISAAALQAALEDLAGIGAGNVAVTRNDDVYVVRFQGERTNADIDELIATNIDLKRRVEQPGGDIELPLPDGSVTVSTRVDGTADVDPSPLNVLTVNDMQVLTVDATGGTYTLSLLNGAITTAEIAYDAGADVVRQALQDAFAGDDEFAALKFEFTVDKYGSTYIIGFQGKLRQVDDGTGADFLVVDASGLTGAASVATRMDGINYYGFETVNISLGTQSDVLNIQGTTAGSRGFYEDISINNGIAVTNITLGAGSDQLYVSSNADLDFASSTPSFDFLTGNLDDVNGALNLDFGTGRHRLMISDESTARGDNNDGFGSNDGTSIVITDTAPGDRAARQLAASAEIWVTGLSGRPDLGFPEGGISYNVHADGNLFDGIVYWTGSGADEITIDGTHNRPGSGYRTMTLLNTGLGDDHITVDLDNPTDDGFFVLHTMGGSASVSPVDPGISVSDDDTVRAADSTLPLIIFGGLGDDDIIAGQNKDIVFGDFGRVQYLDGGGNVIAVLGYGGRGDRTSSVIIDPTWVISRDLNLGGNDIIEGQGDDDLLIGGANTHNSPRGTDYIDGDTGEDLIFGDLVRLFRRDTDVVATGDITNPRFQALRGQMIYGRNDLPASLQGLPDTNGDGLPDFSGDEAGEVLVDGVARNYRNQNDPDGPPAWAEYQIIELYHSFDIEDGVIPEVLDSFGDDYIAGGADHDVIFGQLGDDIIQGDGSIASAVGPESVNVNRITNLQSGLVPVGAQRVSALDIALTPTLTVDSIGTLQITPSFEAATDGDDYIEGNGGDDVIFSNLGQDDIIGGSSSLFTLTAADQRPDGEDIIFGGAGTRIDRNHAVDDGNKGTIILDQLHARDADVIAGDNANIYRLVGTNHTDGGSFLKFNYDLASLDGYDAGRPIIPRAVELLDYTPGGPDFDAASAANDIGGADEVHGESGDDFIYGMKGNDVLFGDSEDDDLIGGWGHDWISAGTGSDGVIGDDGRIFTGRYVAANLTGNNVIDPTNIDHYAEPLNGVLKVNGLNREIGTPGDLQLAIINPTLDGTSSTVGQLFKSVDLTPFNLTPSTVGSDDPLFDPDYADDIIYGGLGKDFLHGGSGDDAISGAEALPDFFAEPTNPGDVLRYSLFRASEFADYNEFEPRTKLNPFLLNFATGEGVDQPSTNNGTKQSDGDDVIFGDLGNDWLVGGTGRDHMYGGWGDDLMNADDDLDGQGELNTAPDTHPSYEDRAFGGAGRDVLIGNTGGDRLIDWIGEFNSFIVPFAPFGEFAISRAVLPQLYQFLYDLSESQGADSSRAADTGNDPLRNGEPDGELGLITQRDQAWQDQTGAPDDPQPGNIAGGKRDVLRAADFNNGQFQGFAADSGVWSAQSGRLTVSAESLGGDAVAVFDVGDALPSYFEVLASISVDKPTGGWKANSYIIFDYQSEYDFKFTGLDVSTNKLVMGHRDATGWIVDKQAPFLGSAKYGTSYNLLVAVNGVNAILMVDNKTVFTHTYQPRVVDGYSYGLNTGMVGVGSDNSRGSFDNVKVQVLPPQVTFENTEDFSDGVANLFTGDSSGVWTVSGGRYGVSPNGATGVSVMDLGPDELNANSWLEINAKVNAQGRAGFIFDRYDDGSFKFVAIDAPADQVIVGHYTVKSGWVNDAVISKVINAGTTDYALGMALKNSTVSVTLGGQAVMGFAFNAATVDGNFGLMATGGEASFDDVRVRTDDQAFVAASGSNMVAAESALTTTDRGTGITQTELDAITVSAMTQWIDALGNGDPRLAGLGGMQVRMGDLAGDALGYSTGRSILIDADAAGYGWSIDSAAWSGDAFGRMDLATVVSHEIGHVLGLDHDDADGFAVMGTALDAGARYGFGASGFDEGPGKSGNDLRVTMRATGWEAVSGASGLPAFDLGSGATSGNGSIDWQAASGENWGVRLSPYASTKPAKSASSANFSDFLLKLSGGKDEGLKPQSKGYDALGAALRGSKAASRSF